jgi:hypothetical protein
MNESCENPMPLKDLPTRMLLMKDQITQSVINKRRNPYSVRSLVIISLMLLVSSMSTKAWAGFDYKLKYDKFSNRKTASYDLSVDSECKLSATATSSISHCMFINTSKKGIDPTLLLMTSSSGWDIMNYRRLSPYKEGRIPAIITYKNGKTIRKLLEVEYQGDTLGGSRVMETIMVELKPISQSILQISQIELKYGTNEYVVSFDPILTKKALNLQD